MAWHVKDRIRQMDSFFEVEGDLDPSYSLCLNSKEGEISLLVPLCCFLPGKRGIYSLSQLMCGQTKVGDIYDQFNLYNNSAIGVKYFVGNKASIQRS